MSFDEEAELLAQFEEQAQKGQMVEISVIAAAYEKKSDTPSAEARYIMS